MGIRGLDKKASVRDVVETFYAAPSNAVSRICLLPARGETFVHYWKRSQITDNLLTLLLADGKSQPTRGAYLCELDANIAVLRDVYRLLCGKWTKS